MKCTQCFQSESFFQKCWSRSQFFKNAEVRVGFSKLLESVFQNFWSRSPFFKTAGVGFSKLLESESVFQNCWSRSRNPKKSSDSTTLDYSNLTYTNRRLPLATVISKSNTCVSLIIMVPTLLHFCNRYENSSSLARNTSSSTSLSLLVIYTDNFHTFCYKMDWHVSITGKILASIHPYHVSQNLCISLHRTLLISFNYNKLFWTINYCSHEIKQTNILLFPLCPPFFLLLVIVSGENFPCHR